MDHNRHTVTKYLSDEKTHAATNKKLFKELVHVNNALNEVEIGKTQLEHTELIIFGFSTLRFAKLRILELYYSFFTKLIDVRTSKSWKWTLSLCILLLPIKNWNTVYDLKSKQSGRNFGQKIVTIVLLLMESEIFSPECAVTSTKKLTSKSLVFLLRNLGVRKCCVFVIKLTDADETS